jgi:translation elongation factor P/translation initiation factor 5A
MVQKKAGEIKEGNVIVVYGEQAVVKKIETSGKGIKQGRIKCRIEAESLKDKKPLIVIRLAEDLIEVAK